MTGRNIKMPHGTWQRLETWLHQNKMDINTFSRELSVETATVYSWKYRGVPAKEWFNISDAVGIDPRFLGTGEKSSADSIYEDILNILPKIDDSLYPKLARFFQNSVLSDLGFEHKEINHFKICLLGISKFPRKHIAFLRLVLGLAEDASKNKEMVKHLDNIVNQNIYSLQS